MNNPVNIVVAMIKALKEESIFIQDGEIHTIQEVELRDMESDFSTWIVWTDPKPEED